MNAMIQTIKPIDKILSALEARDCEPKRIGVNGYKSLCPCHNDHKSSLSITETNDGTVLLHCHANASCATQDIVSTLGLQMKDLFSPSGRSGKFEITATYDYRDESGNLLFQVCRTTDKGFPVRRPDGQGEWLWGLDKTRRVLYRLPEIVKKVKAGETIWLPEGERDVDNLWAIGLPATCNPGGAGKWKDEYSEFLRGVAIVILPDNDQPGKEHAQYVAQKLQGIASEVRILELPKLPEKGDVSDWLANGGSKEKLLELAEAAPKWAPKPENEKTTHETYNLTDLGNAQRLVAQHKADLRYCHPWKRWLVWDGTRWALDATAEVFRRAKDTVRKIYDEASRSENPEQRKKIAEHAMRSESEHRIGAMISLANSEPDIPVLPEELDRNSWLLNVLNGAIDLCDGLFYPHKREDMITKLAPVEYDPLAQCPTWYAFLDRTMAGNQDLIEFLQRVVGYALTGSVQEQKLFFLYGSGCNGKTTFLNTLLALLGDYGKQVDSELLLLHKGEKHPTAYADLYKTRLAICIEVEEGKRLAEVMTKQLTGGDRIAARRMRQDFFQFEPSHKIFLGANHKPLIRGTDLAIWRRIDLIPFNVVIPEQEQDKNLLAKLKAELPGILNWALIGLIDWLDQGLLEPEEVKAATKEYRSDMDILQDFLKDCCTIAPSEQILNKELRATYIKWCEQNGEKPVGDKNFSLRLQEKGFLRDRTNQARLWKGITIKKDSGFF